MAELLTNTFFENPLRKYFGNDSFKVVKCESINAISVGENYTSDIFRTTITYIKDKSNNEETLSVIVKCFPTNEMINELVTDLQLFETEADVYSNVLSSINYSLMESERVSAKCIHYEKEETQIIVFEDLSTQNFKMHPRREGLDLKHCLLVVEKLACLHAASLVLYSKDPSSISKYTNGIYGQREFFKQWITVGLEELIKACLKWPECEKYAKKLEAIKGRAFIRLQDSKVRKEFNVLNHGDPWINNIMFMYDADGNVNDLRFVDFQLAFYGSPTIDLMYFWTSSPNIEVRLNHFETIINHYYDKLTEVLTRMNYSLENVPSKEELLEDFYSRIYYGLATSITTLPIVAAPNRDDATMDEMVNGKDDGFRYDSYNNECYKKYMEYLLPYFEKQGLFD